MFSLFGGDVINMKCFSVTITFHCSFPAVFHLYLHPIATIIPQLDSVLQILDRSTDIFEVLFVGSAVKYLFNEKPHILEGIK